MSQAAMVYWLVLHMFGSGPSTTVVPVPYSSKDACEAAGAAYEEEASGWYNASSECLPMPEDDLRLSSVRGMVLP